MLVSDLEYELPEELIAQHPLDRRDASRMMIVDRTSGSFFDSKFIEFSEQLNAGDLVVINNTRVFPARLRGVRRPSRGRVELFLVRELGANVWEALARPARRLNKGTRIEFGNGRLQAEIVDTSNDGLRVVRFECNDGLETVLDEVGETPLPPYIKRDEQSLAEDRDRYQTIYARIRGAIAAPTAGLHFTSHVIDELKSHEIRIAEITLHVGYGTFQPVRVTDFSEHRVAPEYCEIGDEAARMINDARHAGQRIIAVGTTTTRALESAANQDGLVAAGPRMADLTIFPGFTFRIVDALLTNFHLPGSSLLALVAAFAGYDLTMAAYRHAVDERYRFYSYGDCMLII